MINKIKINNRLSAILTLPDCAKEKLPTILFLHGFGTDKNEVGNIFGIATANSSRFGVCSLSIDFSGFGESKGNAYDTTIDKLINDANTALDYLLNLEFVDVNRIGLCGFSLGAGISVLIAEKRIARIKSMSLLSPAGNLEEDFLNYLGGEQYKQLENANSIIELDLGWRKIKLKNKFIKSLKKYTLMNAIAKYQGAFFVVAGINDFSYKHATTYYSCVNTLKKDKFFIKNADHIFNAYDANSKIEEVANSVAEWFKKTL